MSAALDATSQGTPTSAATQNWNHTFGAGSGRVAVVAVPLGAQGGPGTAGTVAVTCVKGGSDTAMTSLNLGGTGSGVGGAGGFGYLELFYLLDPDVGTTTIKVTRTGGSGTQDLRGCAVSFLGGGTPTLEDTDTGNGTTGIQSVFTIASGDIPMSVAIQGNQITGGSDTQLWLLGSGNASGASYMRGAIETGTSGSVTLSHTVATTDDWAVLGVKIPSGGPPPPSVALLLESGLGYLLNESGVPLFLE